MTLEARARAFAEAVQRSAMGVDPVAGLEDLLRRRRRRRVARVATALATAAAVALVAWVASRGSEQEAPITNPPPGSLGRVAATIPVGAGPVDVVAAEGAVWVANAAQSTVSRIDPAINTVTRTTPVGRNPVRLAAGFGSIWVANQTGQTVSRLDVRTGQLQATIPITGHSSADDLAVGAGMVWVRSGNRLLPLDPATNTMTDRTSDWEVGGKHLTADAESLWVSSDSSRVIRIDMATSTVTGTLQVSDRAPAVAVGHGAVWIVDTARTALLRVQH